MKAVMYQGPMRVSVEGVDEPKMQEPTDAVVRMTSSAICGSDPHISTSRLSS